MISRMETAAPTVDPDPYSRCALPKAGWLPAPGRPRRAAGLFPTAPLTTGLPLARRAAWIAGFVCWRGPQGQGQSDKDRAIKSQNDDAHDDEQPDHERAQRGHWTVRR